MPGTQRANEAQIRVNPESGAQFIYVAKPHVVAASEMDEDDLAAFENARPTAEDLVSDRWLDD